MHTISYEAFVRKKKTLLPILRSRYKFFTVHTGFDTLSINLIPTSLASSQS